MVVRGVHVEVLRRPAGVVVLPVSVADEKRILNGRNGYLIEREDTLFVRTSRTAGFGPKVYVAVVELLPVKLGVCGRTDGERLVFTDFYIPNEVGHFRVDLARRHGDADLCVARPGLLSAAAQGAIRRAGFVTDITTALVVGTLVGIEQDVITCGQSVEGGDRIFRVERLDTNDGLSPGRDLRRTRGRHSEKRQEQRRQT